MQSNRAEQSNDLHRIEKRVSVNESIAQDCLHQLRNYLQTIDAAIKAHPTYLSLQNAMSDFQKQVCSTFIG